MLTDTSNSDDVGGILDGTPSTTEDKATKKRKAPKSAPKTAKVYKLDTTKPNGKGNGKDTTAKKAKTEAEPALPKKAKGKTAEPAKKGKTAEAEPKRVKPVQSDISTQQPEDNVTLKAVRKLKQPMLAAAFSLGLGVHRRVIRVQLQRLAKDKANGVGMKKQGANWWVSNTEK